MQPSVLVFDPTISDEQTKVRGVGRYLQILRENFAKQWNFSNVLTNESQVFINSFFNLLQTPVTLRRIAKKQIAVIHDLIPLKYPEHFPIGIKGKLNVWLNKLALKNYDLIVTDSEASKKDIIQMLKFSENKVEVIYPCLPKVFTRRNDKSITNSKVQISNYSLYVGDATWNKI